MRPTVMTTGGNETNLFEPLLMVGAVVNVHNPSLIPRDTESYREVSWVDLDSYRKGVLGREAALLIPDIKPEDEAGVCVRGLCLVTSKAAVSGGSGIAAHLG